MWTWTELSEEGRGSLTFSMAAFWAFVENSRTLHWAFLYEIPGISWAERPKFRARHCFLSKRKIERYMTSAGVCKGNGSTQATGHR